MVGEEETNREIGVEVEYRRQVAICPRCGQMTGKVHSTSVQTKKDRRLWDKPVYLILRQRRFRCLGCGKVFTEPDAVCGTRRRTSQRFRCRLRQEAIDQPARHVARREGAGEALVRRCFTEEAGRRVGVAFKPVAARIPGLDEFSVKKGRVYDTATVNLEGKQIIGVVSGHREKGVEDFFDSLSQPEKVQVVVMDMYKPFRQAVEMCLPPGQVWVISPGSSGENAGLYRIDVTEGPGAGVRILNQPTPAPFRESVRCAEQNLYTRARLLVGDRDPRAHEFSVQLRAFDIAKSGASVGMGVLLALCSSLLGKSLKGGMVIVGGLNLGGSTEPVHNAVNIVEVAVEKGGAHILMPVSSRRQLNDLPDDLATKITIFYYADPQDALMKALTE